MDIQFLDGYQYDSDRIAYKLIAVANNQRIVCLVSVEALQDNFGANDGPSVARAFLDNKSVIENLAASKIRQNLIEPNGEVLVRNTELAQFT